MIAAARNILIYPNRPDSSNTTYYKWKSKCDAVNRMFFILFYFVSVYAGNSKSIWDYTRGCLHLRHRFTIDDNRVLPVRVILRPAVYGLLVIMSHHDRIGMAILKNIGLSLQIRRVGSGPMWG